MLQFHLLGPLEVWHGQRLVAIPRRKPRALLAALLLRGGEVVSADRLIDDLWGERAPATAKVALQNYVSFLRKLLGPETVATRPSGYLLHVDPDQVDLRRFERLSAEARAAASREERAAMLRKALALWRGPPLADLAFEPFALLETPRLEELRRSAYEELIDAELALGRHGELLPEVEALVSEHPFDERLRAQLMVILYRSGRQADALEAYRETRQLLIEELGIEPSPQLRDLEQSILRQDPALVASARIPATLPVRKTVTVLFADLVDSTALSEQLDPEALRQLLERMFAAMRGALERHGGTVEKFIGDAVLAVFGVPAAHEDDALRAVRAAVEMRDELAGLSDELERERGLRLRVRIGVNTGEVFAGDATASGALVTGAAVNAAKRLEEAAPPGEVVLGAATLRLVRDAVRVESGELLRLSEDSTLGTWRLLGIVEGAPAIARRLEAPLVGRQEELAQLLSAFEQAREERRCELLVLAGEPGIGKTRLAREFVGAVSAEATVITGACASYGEGATWLPLAEMVHQLGDPAALLAGEERAEIVAQRVEELIGLSEGAGSRDEAFWAVRQLFDAMARRRPLVAVFEDVHWAEPTLLDLIENLAERSSGVPLLVLGLTRPELLEARPHLTERTITLAPLADEKVRALVDSLESDLDPEVRARVVEVAEGNPLFVEQLVAYAAEDQVEAVQRLETVPPSLEALLASRLDLLVPEERVVLQRAAIVGREFRRDMLIDLVPPEASAAVDRHLRSLGEKGFVRPSESEYRLSFNHVLVRDVAYAGIPKAERARLHERVADWLKNRAGDRIGEIEEIVAYHLEQTYHYRLNLNPADPIALDLAPRAAELLESAARRAGAHEDMEAAAKLLYRATELLPRHDRMRLQLLLQLGEALRWVRSLDRAAAVLKEAVECARALDERGVE
jgi:DNA-binding SARP family transcriptional activator